MKKRIKKIIVLCMALAMLFGNVLTVSASETAEGITFENSLRKYFTLTKSFDMVGGSGSIVRYKVVRYEFSEPVYVGIFRRYRPDLDDDHFNVWMISEKENVKYGNISQTEKEEYLQDLLDKEIELDSTLSGRFVADGKTYYYMELNCSFCDGYNSTLPVYACPAEYPELGSPEQLVKAFSSGYKFTHTEISDSEMTYDPNIPTPELVFYDDGRLRFGFNNSTDDYYFELRGRWWSVDDITLFKKNLMWKYSYESLIKNDLSTWVNNISYISAIGQHDLAVYGENSFNDLLSVYPVENRTYLGGTNAIGNFLSGYNDGLDTLKMLLKTSSSAYNSCEFYVRYYTIDDSGNYSYGKWCHWLGNLANAEGSSGSLIDDDNIYKGQQSEKGLTDEEMEILESSGNSRNDIDLKEETFGEYESPITGATSGDIVNYFQTAINVISDVGNMLGEFPVLVARVFSFMPDWVIACIGLGIVLVIILRIVGR